MNECDDVCQVELCYSLIDLGLRFGLGCKKHDLSIMHDVEQNKAQKLMNFVYVIQKKIIETLNIKQKVIKF